MKLSEITNTMLPDRFLHLCRLFGQEAHDIYLVGGAVRDLLMNRPLHDLDCTTDAEPDEIERIIEDAAASGALPTPFCLNIVGKRFGTIQVIFPDAKVLPPIEITTYRREFYDETTGRKPIVTFGKDLLEDLARRDFTCNAIAYNPHSGRITDPFNGRKDIEEKILRPVGNASDRFQEDPLRLMRAVRFSCQLQFFTPYWLDQEMAKCTHLLKNISVERIHEEMDKILLSDPYHGLLFLFNTALLAQFMPEAVGMVDLSQRPFHKEDVFIHTLLVTQGVKPELVLRWAALLHDIGKSAMHTIEDGKDRFYGHAEKGAEMAREILTRLKYPNKFIDQVTRLVELHMRPHYYESGWGKKPIRQLLKDCGSYTTFEQLLALAKADDESDLVDEFLAERSSLEELRERAMQVSLEVPIEKMQSPVNGHELMERFSLQPGPYLGGLLNFLGEQVVDGLLLPEDKEQAFSLASTYIEMPKIVEGE